MFRWPMNGVNFEGNKLPSPAISNAFSAYETVLLLSLQSLASATVAKQGLYIPIRTWCHCFDFLSFPLETKRCYD